MMPDLDHSQPYASPARRGIGIPLGFMLLLAWACPAPAAEPVAKEFLGTYEGSGRACHGILHLTPRRFSWKTAFMTIQDAPYEVLEQQADATHQRLVVHLKKRSRTWQLPIVLLELNRNAAPYAWNATAYRSMEGYRQDDPDNLSCLLFKR